MKNSFLLAGLLLAGPAARAQNSLYAGGWSTDNATKTTAIAVGPALLPRVYQLSSTILADSDVLRFRVIVDGVPVGQLMAEGSFVVVEGKNVVIKQETPGRLIKGSWKVLQQADVQAESSQWEIYPHLNEEQLLATLKTEQEFVVSLNNTQGVCTGIVLTVLVDGVPLKDHAGAVLAFVEGSTVVARGKLVTARVVGTCRSNGSISGQLRLARK